MNVMTPLFVLPAIVSEAPNPQSRGSTVVEDCKERKQNRVKMLTDEVAQVQEVSVFTAHSLTMENVCDLCEFIICVVFVVR